MNTKKITMFMCDEIVKRYNSTAAMVFGHCAYHIVTHGQFNGTPNAVKTVTGIGASTARQYINLFINDGLFTKVTGKFAWQTNLVFCDDATDEDKQIFQAYHATFNHNYKKPADNNVFIVEVGISQYVTNWEMGKKAEHQRSWLYVAAYIRDRLANAQSSNKDQVFYAGYFTRLAKTFGLSINTVKKLIKKLVSQQYIKTTREDNRLQITASHYLHQAIKTKAARIKKAIAKAMTTKPEQRRSIKLPGRRKPIEIPS